MKIDCRAVGVRLVRCEAAAPRPSALRVNEAQLGMRLAQFPIGIAHGVANGLVRKGAAKEKAEQAIGAIVVARVGQRAAALETAVDDAAVTDARSAKEPEPAEVGGKSEGDCNGRKDGS